MVKLNSVTKYQYDGKLMSKLLSKKREEVGKNIGGLSMAQLGRIVGIARSTAMRAERGETIDAATIYCLCKWLDKPMEIFFIKSKK